MYYIYTKPSCTYCKQAKSLLTSKDLEYKEYEIDVGQVKDNNRQYVTISDLKAKVPSARTVPQIFSDNVYIGGFTDLYKSLQ